ncbi:fidgetin-like [Arapaima gigas]
MCADVTLGGDCGTVGCLLPVGLNGLKMQWTPEHAQWAEQHFDISSTTRSPAHKAEAYMGHLQQTYHYAWANDDISALTASNLLKRYAEKYSGILEGQNERTPLSSYASITPGLLNGRKSESETWQERAYPMSCIPDGISASKSGSTAALATADVSTSIGSSPGLAATLTEPSYSSTNCGSHVVAGLHAALPSQEYSAGYSGSFLHSSYSGQSALSSPHPSPLHSSGILQPPPPPPPPPTLVASYGTGSSSLPSYNYPSVEYPPQTAVASGYSHGGAPPPSVYLPTDIAAPTPLPPSTLPGYSYQSHSLPPIAPTPLNSNSASSLKRKAFYMTGQGEINSGYGNFSYTQQRSTESPIYSVADNSIPNAAGGNGFDRNAESSSLAFKPKKQLLPSDQKRKFSSQSSRVSTPPSYPSARGPLVGSQLVESFGKFASPVTSEQGDDHRQLSRLLPASSVGTAVSSTHPTREQFEDIEPHLVELITSEIIRHDVPVDWSDIAGLELAKAVIKEDLLWPMLRPDMFADLSAIPRSILLFGPQGTGRTLLSRCIASQLGAAFFQLSGSALVTKWLGEGEKIIHACFLVARCRQPAVVFVSDVDVLLSAQHGEESPVNRVKNELLVQLDGVLASSEDNVVVICSTSKPEEIDESLRRYFMKRLLIPLPDSTARQQIISQLLSQHNYCLSEKEVASLVMHTEGYSGLDIAHLCQEAVVGLLHATGAELSAILPSQLRPVTYQDFKNVFCKIQPSRSQKDLDSYTEWNRMFGCSH